MHAWVGIYIAAKLLYDERSNTTNVATTRRYLYVPPGTMYAHAYGQIESTFINGVTTLSLIHI